MVIHAGLRSKMASYLHFQDQAFETMSVKPGILVIEDDADLLSTVKSMLQSEGFKVYTSSTGVDALSIIEEKKPGLIITDIFLGGIDGRVICQCVKQNPETRHIPIIVMSGAPEIYNSIQHFGANDVVLKPFDNETLMNRVQRQVCA